MFVGRAVINGVFPPQVREAPHLEGTPRGSTQIRGMAVSSIPSASLARGNEDLRHLYGKLVPGRSDAWGTVTHAQDTQRTQGKGCTLVKEQDMRSVC